MTIIATLFLICIVEYMPFMLLYYYSCKGEIKKEKHIAFIVQMTIVISH